MKRATQKVVKSYADLINIDHTAAESEKKHTTTLNKPKKVVATSYKKELAEFLKHTATKRFGEVLDYKSRDTDGSGFPLKRTEKQIQSLNNWKKHCVRIYEDDFKKECMLEVGGKLFMKPTNIPESISALTELCLKFHEQVEGAHGRQVPFAAGLYKATIQRFHDMREEKR